MATSTALPGNVLCLKEAISAETADDQGGHRGSGRQGDGREQRCEMAPIGDDRSVAGKAVLPAGAHQEQASQRQ